MFYDNLKMNNFKGVIYYVDTMNTGIVHDQFNAALLSLLCEVSDRVECRMGKSAFMSVKSILPNMNIRNRQVYVPLGTSKVIFIFRIIVSIFNILLLLYKSSRCDIIVFNNNNIFALYLLNSLNFIFKRKIFIFCHGEMEFLYNYRKIDRMYLKLLSFFVKSFFCGNFRVSKNLNFVVLGDSIYNSLKEILSSDRMDRIYSLDHPYIFEEKENAEKKHDNISIGVFKVVSEEEFKILISVANGLNLIVNDHIHLTVIGSVYANDSVLEEVGVKILNKVNVERYIFDDIIDKFDFLLLLYSRDSYMLTASGVVIDAINRRKPIIALKNRYVEYLFNKYVPFGFLVDNVEEIIDVVNSIYDSTIDAFKFDFDCLQKKLSPNGLKKEIINILNI